MRVASNKQKVIAIAIVLIMASSLVIGTFAQLASGASESAAFTNADTEQIHVSVGDNFSCALLNDGTVKCWGKNNLGQLGRDNTTAVGSSTNDMRLLTPIFLGTGRTAVALSAGSTHACAVLDNATVKCWGDNSTGALGLGTTTNAGDGVGTVMSALPSVDLGAGVSVREIHVGNGFTCALLTNATVKCWGKNDKGQLGLGDIDNRGDGPNEMGAALPIVDLGVNKTAIAIAVADASVCAILNLGEVKCWGDNTDGQLGQGNDTSVGGAGVPAVASINPVDLGAGVTAKGIAAGASHFCALLQNDTVKCWGKNDKGQLGLGDIDNRGDDLNEMGASLTAVNLGSGLSATSIAAGGSSTCALLNTGAVKCWGENASGQLGQGNTDSLGIAAGDIASATAVNITTNTTVVSLSAGQRNTCAVVVGPSLKCWGDNTDGQLGQGNTTALGVASGDIAAVQPITIDTSAPAITTEAPENARVLRTPTPTYSGRCEARIPVVVNVYVGSAATGTPVQTLSGVCNTGVYAVTATQGLSNNAYTFTVSQTDAAGNLGRTLPVTYLLAATLWTTPPDADTNTAIRGEVVTSLAPGPVYVTKDFGFRMLNPRNLKPRVRMKDYVGVVRLTLTANYVRSGQVRTYKCTYPPFGRSARWAEAKWRWTISPRVCVLPVLLRNQLIAGTTTLRVQGTVTRYWATTGARVRPDGSRITLRRINVVLRHG